MSFTGFASGCRTRALQRAGLAAAVMICVGACGAQQDKPAAPAPSTVVTPSGTEAPSRTPASAVTDSGAQKPPQRPSVMSASPPKAVRVPALGVQSSLSRLGLNPDGTVEVPPVSRPMQAGWYEQSPTPGERGPAVVLGHIDGNHKRGIFYKLGSMHSGQRIAVDRADGSTAQFQVYRTQRVDKDTFPTDAVYGNTEGSELRLISCGGAFDRSAHSYEDSIIVYARLLVP